MTKASSLKELQQIPGVGKAVALDLWNLGYTCVSDLKGENPELMYIHHNDQRGSVQDICMLYTFRCAVYFADTQGQKQDPEKLRWWSWMDKVKTDSVSKDQELRAKYCVKTRSKGPFSIGKPSTS